MSFPAPPTMKRVHVRGADLEYETRGQGEPILLIHGSHISNSFVTLLDQSALTDHFTLVRYHRRGFMGSSTVHGSFSMAEQAADAAALVDALGLGPAHVIGHSYGGAIAMQMAIDHPEQTASLILFEAALLTVPGGEGVFALVDVAEDLYNKGNWEAAVDLFLGSPGERADVSRNVPGGLDNAIRDVDTYFTIEAPAHEEWHFGPEEGARLTCPIFYLMGGNSNELYRTVYHQICEWAPQTESGVVEGASHLLHIQQPAGAAEHVAAFCKRHPVLTGPSAERRRHLENRYNATVDILEGNLRAGRADDLAIHTPTREWTYAEISDLTNRTGNALRHLGVEIEDRVLMVCADSAEFAATFFGAMKIGAVPVPAPTSLAIEDYAHLLEHTRAKVAVVSEAYLRGVREALTQPNFLEHLVVIGTPRGQEVAFDDLVGQAAAELDPAPTTRDDPAFWLYTTGTDGHPLAIVHAHRAMRASADTLGAVLALTPSDRVFCASKLFHANGLGAALYLPFAAGASTVLAHEPPQVRMILHTLRTFQPTVYCAFPANYAALLDAGRSRKGNEFPSVRLCVSATDPMSPTLARRWQDEIGVEILDCLGMYETCHAVLTSRLGAHSTPEPGSAIRQYPVPGYEARVVDDAYRPVPPGEVGRLLVRGPSVFEGYWHDSAATRAIMHGDWLDTGFRYAVDPDGGGLIPHERTDGVFKVSGAWVAAAEVERLLARSDIITECAVFIRRDDNGVAKLEAMVVKSDAAADEGLADEEVAGELRRLARTRLGGAKTPRHFHFVDALPRDADGEVARGHLAEVAARIVAPEVPALSAEFTG